MDLEMPVMGGIEATRKALAMQPNLKILVLTMLGMKNNYVYVIDAGVKGFIFITSGKQELEKAIKNNKYFG